MKTHQEYDERSLVLHRLIADKVRKNPALLSKAKEAIIHWRKTIDPRSVIYLNEWQSLIDQGIDICLAVATEDSERARALRQSSPFTDVLTPKERWAFLDDWKQQHGAK